MLPHLARGVSQYARAVGQRHAKLRVRQDFVDHALHLDNFFLRHVRPRLSAGSMDRLRSRRLQDLPGPRETRAVPTACPSNDYRAFRFTADVLPSLPFSRSNEIFCFSLRLPSPARSTAEMCTKTSFEPSSGWMKPKPLVALKNFTVPVAIDASRFGVTARGSARGVKRPMGENRKRRP